jgi:BolA protein
MKIGFGEKIMPVSLQNIGLERVGMIRSRLEKMFNPTLLIVTDDSHRHIGHEGARDGRGHFTVQIESADFAHKSLIARHRMIYSALGELMQTDIHALAIQARNPGE